MSTNKTAKNAKKTPAMPTTKRGGVVYALVTPSHLTKLKNDVKRFKAKATTIVEPIKVNPLTEIESIQPNGIETMGGTESSSVFNVIANLPSGKAGYRSIGNGQYRVRVVPSEATELELAGWKAPSYGYNRYSTVVTGVAGLISALATAQFALSQAV